MRRPKLTLLRFATLMSFVATACGPMESMLKIQGGEFIKAEMVNTMPATIAISSSDGAGCSATIVSSNTLITAAHCIQRGGGGTISINRGGKYPIQATSSKIILHPDYRDNDVTMEGAASDVAIVIFDANAFKFFVEVYNRELQVSEPTILVGYSRLEGESKQEVLDEKGGSKRWGFSSVSSRSNGVLEGIYDNIGLHQGDSGGTLLNKSCQLAGVASRVAGFNKGASFNHTDLTFASTQTWLKQQESQGAYYCGLTGNDPAKCPASGKTVVDSNPAAKEIPCKLSSEPDSGSVSPAPQPQPTPGAFKINLLQSAGKIYFEFSYPSRVSPTDVFICKGTDANACTSSQVNHAFLRTNSNGRQIHHSQEITLGDYLVKDAKSGGIIRKFKITQ